MYVIEPLVAPYCVHICVKSVADTEIVSLERESLPLCKRMNDLRVKTDRGDIERDGALLAREVVVKTGILGDEEGRGNSL
jgi:hypothetical protein